MRSPRGPHFRKVGAYDGLRSSPTLCRPFFILKDKNMKKLSLLLDSGKNEGYLKRFVNTRSDSKMEVRNVAVYWNFRNIKNFNNTITLTATPKDVTLEEGYWTFHMTEERLAESDVKLDRNRYDNTCKFFSKNSDLNLKSLGPMLGFQRIRP